MTLTAAQIRYDKRVAAFACIQCGAGLFEEEKGTHVICIECRQAKIKYNQSAERKEASRAFARKKYRENRVERNAQWKTKREAKQRDGECRNCSEDATDDSDFCQPHLDAHREQSRDYLRKKRAFKSVLPTMMARFWESLTTNQGDADASAINRPDVQLQVQEAVTRDHRQGEDQGRSDPRQDRGAGDPHP